MNYKTIIPSQNFRFFILRMLGWIPSSIMLKLQYYIKFNRSLNIKNPKRFTEKIQYYKMYYCNPEMPRCVDKYLVRNFLKEKGCEEYLNEIYGNI